MTPERETELFTKVDKIHDSLVGDPLSIPPRKGLIQQHQENMQAISSHGDDIKSLKTWRNQVKMRFAAIGGGILVVGFIFNRAWEWLTSHK